jgi:hypothetical protein
MSFSTFKQYLLVLIAINGKIENENHNEVSKLKQKLLQYESEINQKNSEVSKLVHEKTVLTAEINK